MDYSSFKPSSNIEDHRRMMWTLLSPWLQAYSDLKDHPFETPAGMENSYWDQRIQQLPPGSAPPTSLEAKAGYNSLDQYIPQPALKYLGHK